MTKVAHTPTPWFVDGVRFKMDRSEWHGISWYDEALKRDVNIACVGFDPRTGEGLADAHHIVRAVNAYDDMLAALRWVRANYASGSTREINHRLDSIIARAEGSQP